MKVLSREKIHNYIQKSVLYSSFREIFRFIG
jgi:hypothetical protein